MLGWCKLFVFLHCMDRCNEWMDVCRNGCVSDWGALAGSKGKKVMDFVYVYTMSFFFVARRVPVFVGRINKIQEKEIRYKIVNNKPIKPFVYRFIYLRSYSTQSEIWWKPSVCPHSFARALFLYTHTRYNYWWIWVASEKGVSQRGCFIIRH